jgi:uncharacterized protein with PQ loop repeat
MDPLFHSHFIDRLAFVNGLVSGVALYPQVWAVLSTGAVAGVSALTYALILINSLVWVAYAIHRGLISLGIASILNVVASSLLLLALVLA